MLLNLLTNAILAQTTPGAAGQAVYEVSRLREFDDLRWPLAAIVAVVALLAAAIVYLYRRDTLELRRPVGISLALLRLVALGGLVIYFLGIDAGRLAKSFTTRRSSCWSTSAKAWAWRPVTIHKRPTRKAA